jgi:alpha-aminoadipate carrier protein LysW
MASLKKECPECGHIISLPEDAVDGEVLTCDDCGMDLEVIIEQNSLKLRVAELKGEDWGE